MYFLPSRVREKSIVQVLADHGFRKKYPNTTFKLQGDLHANQKHIV